MTVLQQIERRRAAPARCELPEVSVGKDIIELLTTSMYRDPMTLYREYVQNSADAIDAAVESGLLSDRHIAAIEIEIDYPARRICIRDRGAGVPTKEGAATLTSFGASQKRGASQRGFRGVGRLAALGYCQKLTFRSRSIGDDAILQVTWDCRVLREHLRTSSPESLQSVVAQAVTVHEIKPTNEPPHFFEVTLEGVVRTSSDSLLDELKVEQYLSQVAPVPYSSDFTFAEEINEYIGRFSEQKYFTIKVNERAPISRPYTNIVPLSGNNVTEIAAVEFIPLQINGKVAAVAWIADHTYGGALRLAPSVRGIRARVRDMQVGDENVFADLFPEPRFNAWSIGEVHVFDDRILPNGRRDYFDQNPAFDALRGQVATVAYKIAQKCRAVSTARTRSRRVEQALQKVFSGLTSIERGLLSRDAEQTLRDELLDTCETLINWKLDDHTLSRVQSAIDRLSARSRVKSPIDRLPEHQRVGFRIAVDLLYATVQPREEADRIVERMLNKLRKKR